VDGAGCCINKARLAERTQTSGSVAAVEAVEVDERYVGSAAGRLLELAGETAASEEESFDRSAFTARRHQGDNT
jgi:hypothetical protein